MYYPKANFAKNQKMYRDCTMYQTVPVKFVWYTEKRLVHRKTVVWYSTKTLTPSVLRILPQVKYHTPLLSAG